MRIPLGVKLSVCSPSDTPSSAASTSAVVRAIRISRPGAKKVSSPGHGSEITGVAHAAASKRRTDGDQPARTMSARVTFSVHRCAA